MTSKASLYAELVGADVPIDHHESDLYVPVNAKTRAILGKYEHRAQVTTFIDQRTGALWYDIPFAYMPFWEGSDNES